MNIAPLAIACSLLLSATLSAQTPAVSADKAIYRTGETITITFTNGPANAKDWIGVYPTNVPPGSVDSTIWYYVDGTRDGGNGVASGTIIFTNGLGAPGRWKAYLLENDSYNELASIEFATVAGPTVISDKTFYATNEAIRVSFDRGPGNPKDWIGVYREGQTPGTTNSTIWNYVNGSQTSSTGAVSGTIVFTNGLSSSGKWVAYLLENDGYTQLASAKFSVGAIPAVVPEHSTYYPGNAINVAFTNGPANLKDWVALYPEGVAPGGPAATLWQYTDANGGQAGLSSGNVTFQSGLTNTGVFTAYLLENDGYNVIASNRLEVIPANVPLLQLNSRRYVAGQPITASFTNSPGNTTDWIGIYPAGVTPGSVGATIWAYLNNTQTATDPATAGQVIFADGLRGAGDWVAYLLASDGYEVLARETFTVTASAVRRTNNIVLGTPLIFENFDATPEGELPVGWTKQSFTEVLDENTDLNDLNSVTYANWTVVNVERFQSPLLSYTAHTDTDDYKRVLTNNLEYAINGVIVTNLGSGRILFGDSGYRSGRSQVIYTFTPDYNLTGRTNVAIAFNSLYEQNQDSLGALEYSTDGGTNWLPVVYLIDFRDIVTNDTGGIDVTATFTTERTDVAYYDDPETGETKGGTYGTFIAAPLTDALIPHISGRRDDDPVDSKRVEYFRLPGADNQARVRFRFAYAGTDSWYWGVDNFGIYAAGTQAQTPARLTVARAGSNVTVNWTGEGRLQKTTRLGSAWQNVQVPAGAKSVTEPMDGQAAFYRVITD